MSNPWASSPSSTPASSSSGPQQQPRHHQSLDDDEPDLLYTVGDEVDHYDGHDVLDDDPLSQFNAASAGAASSSISNAPGKRSLFSDPARLFTAFTSARNAHGVSRSPLNTHDSSNTDTNLHDLPPHPSSHHHNGTSTQRDAKHNATTITPQSYSYPSASASARAPDWYAEGPGRRVRYEDLTAIDWIFEYVKERQRLRILYSSAHGLRGHVTRLLDSSQIWIILVLTGIAVGGIAAAIDVASDWLGDWKGGYCSGDGGGGGAFYLNKGFCCLGIDEGAKCEDWKPWAAALGVSSVGGKWFVEYFFFIGLSVFWAFCASVLVQEFAVYAKHSGIPEIKTMLGGLVIRNFLGAWTLIVKSLGLILAVASGMWLGKEGPLVHVACCCANLFTKLFPNVNDNEARQREVLSAAAASGISVAFGSPVGGVLFSLEQLSYYFPDKTMWQSFVCAMTAAVVLQAFDPFRSGQLVLYQVTYTRGWHGFELVPFAMLGIIGGIYGGLFIQANMNVVRWKRAQSRLPGPIAQVVYVSFLTALINYPNLYMRAQSSELVSNLFAECSQLIDDQFGLCKTGSATIGTIVLLLFAAVLGCFLATITFGLQIPAGIILPSMAIGALTGRAVGIIMEIWQHNYPNFLAFETCEPDIPCITPGTYAIIGAAATLAGVTRMTVSIVVIMFELTGALTYVLPIMIAVLISKWVGDSITKAGIYESWIHFNEYPFIDNNNEDAAGMPDIPCSQIMTRIEDLIVLCAEGHTIATLRNTLESHPHRGFPIISDPRRGILLGYISRTELVYNLDSASSLPRALPPSTKVFFSHQPHADPRTTLDLRPWMDQTPLTLPSRSSLHLAVTYFQKLGLRYILFSDRGVLQGLLTKKDVWYVLNGAEETTRATTHYATTDAEGGDVSGRVGGVVAGAGDDSPSGGEESGNDGLWHARRDRANVDRPSVTERESIL